MKAIVLDTDNQYRLTELDEPTPGPGQVAIRVGHVGVQWGDALIRDGRFPVPRPFVAGFDVSGRIHAVGEGVDPGRIGERVAALATGGGYAETVLVPTVLALPSGGLSSAEAAGFGWGATTAYDLIHTVSRLAAGESVLIHAAAGGVGTAAAQFARLAGAGRIVGVVGSPSKVDYALRFGYDEVVPSSGFRDLLAGERFDVVLDSVGGRTSRASLDLLAGGGRLVAFGTAGGEEFSVPATELTMANQAVLGYSSFTLSHTDPGRLADSARRALALVVDGRVRLDITAEYELADVAAAVAAMADRATVGRTVVRVA
ncbi:NADPH:quinone reductase [Longispora fulva]|uniref:NADPH2:quinone reductase n=1 Tax=Longispora fulva TaxID=619741 RepID=A0A8J7KU23_9ACTN|nr:zinc-binding alcohol dehydrogenase family protein [Longispora fulva]MBG6141387.1 NADPH2:quinone reductase [Longispora fulva]GIG59463.1 NADPH:quinone reductase [Longispora fulva]